MLHDAPLVTTIAAAFASALLLGVLARRAGLSPIVGYLLAGVVIGPYTPGFVGDVALATQLAEIGVVLLMFGVGLHFHPRDLLAVRGVAIPGALLQSGGPPCSAWPTSGVGEAVEKSRGGRRPDENADRLR